ncbi:MAG: DUF4124 domain-containing protein [Rhodocyclales bacterium]|nr:DUF4124 domain-containing protein [Rhodocyclales bacterium]
MLVLLADPAGAEGVYKWVDAQGRTHFGSTPPPGQKTERLNSQTATPEAAPAQGNRSWQEQLDLSNQRRQQAREKEQASAKADQENQQRCIAARSALDSLERGGARYRVNEQGERDYLDDSQRQAARDAASQRVATYCR